MKILVTGSAGHLGEALMRTLRADGIEAVGLDILAVAVHRHRRLDRRPRARPRRDARRRRRVHAATLHKPHVGTHTRQDFVDTNVTGTLNLLEEAVAAGRRAASSSPARRAPSAAR